MSNRDGPLGVSQTVDCKIRPGEQAGSVQTRTLRSVGLVLGIDKLALQFLE